MEIYGSYWVEFCQIFIFRVISLHILHEYSYSERFRASWRADNNHWKSVINSNEETINIFLNGWVSSDWTIINFKSMEKVCLLDWLNFLYKTFWQIKTFLNRWIEMFLNLLRFYPQSVTENKTHNQSSFLSFIMTNVNSCIFVCI